jgi:HSP20 family molecular chaperone IbpA
MALPSVLDEIDRLFDELVRRPWGAASRQVVPVQLREVKDGWVVDLPVEGLRAADLKVEAHDRQLRVTGQRRSGGERRQHGQWMHTREEVSWYRTIPLPAGANPDDIEASVEGSTLSIHIGRRKR